MGRGRGREGKGGGEGEGKRGGKGVIQYTMSGRGREGLKLSE